MRDDTMARPTPLPGLDRIDPYKPGESAIAGRTEVVKLSSNENALGTSPRAREAFKATASHLHDYPEGSARALREAAGKLHDIDPARIVCGAGSDELLQLIAKAYAGPGDEILYTEYSFQVYPLVAKQVRATGVAAPETGFTADVDALLSRVSEKTKILFLANPNNPTGTMLSSGEIARLHAGLPETTLLVLDAAYAEYVDDPDYDGGQALALEAPNVVMTRTLSKIYGLAALRAGWMTGSAEVIDVINRMRGPFNVTGPAIAAAAAAMEDQAFVKACAAHNAAELNRLEAAADRLGILGANSKANFVMLQFANEPGRTAADADAHLKSRGLIVRRLEKFGLGDCLRVTVGTAEDNTRVIEALDAFMGEA
ncbi:MAG: histidinol-phosphate transaminase [Maricaulaceae bacterium]|jgi:histidinol-phosphate aminotransferase